MNPCKKPPEKRAREVPLFPLNTRILVTDDIKMMRNIVKSILRKLGYTEISEACSGNQAFGMLKAAAEAGTPFGLVISDWNMPDGAGIDCLRNCKADSLLDSTPFLMVTAESEQHQIVEAIQLGVSHYLIKPFNQDALIAKLHIVYNKQHPRKKSA